MPIQTAAAASGATALSNSVRTQYVNEYLEGALRQRLYDQISRPIGKNMEELQKGSSVQVNYLSTMDPGTTAISEVSDIVPQALRDATASITPTSRGEMLQASELLLIQNYVTDYGKEMFKAVGQNMMESVDIIAKDKALAGTLVYRPSGVARATLNKTSTGHRATDGLFSQMATWLNQLHCPGFLDPMSKQEVFVCIVHPAVWHDIRQDGNVNNIAIYQNQNILFNWEMGSIGPFRFVVSPYAKVFYGAGAAEATDPQATTTNAAVKALDKTMTVSTATHLDNQQWLNILDGVESSTTFYPKNEQVRVISQTTSTITFVGMGPNGGLLHDHANGITINNNNSVYTMVFGGPQSLAKVYSTSVGEYGTVVGPQKMGNLEQWTGIGWKWYGNYGIMSENNIIRCEVSSSLSNT